MSGAVLPPESPRVAALVAQVAKADPGAVDDFWAEVSRTGTPLVEPVDGRDDRRLVTFVWRGTSAQVRKVELRGTPRWRSPLASWLEAATFAQDALPTRQLTQVAGTDIWFDTSTVRSDLRMTYTIAEVTGDANGDQDAPGRRDPFNPRVFPDDTMDRSIPGDRSGNGDLISVAELPDARPLTWVRRRPDVPRGTVVEHVHHSEARESSRRVWVHLPAGYESTDHAYPVMVLHDGWEWAALTPVAPILDNLIAEGRIPALVTVMHESPDREELACREPFVDFLAAELLPWARRLYRVTEEPARTIVAGQSYGGLNAAFCALQRPDVFGNVLSQSGSFWFRAGTEFDVEFGWLISRYVSSPTLPVRFYLDVGLLEAYMVPVNRHLRDVLRAKGYPVAYQEFNGDHSWLCWRDTISDGLFWLTSQW